MRRLLLLLALLLPVPTMAQTAPPTRVAVVASPALTARIDQLVGVLAGSGDFDAYFAPSFRAAIPREKWAAVNTQLAAQMGKPLAIDSFKAATPFSADVRVKFERGIVTVQIGIAPDAPNQIVGLLLTGTEVAGDSFDKLTTDFRALPGASGFGVYFFDLPMTNGSSSSNALPVAPPNYRVIGYRTEQAAPLGSAFKLWVFGELAREVNAGERRWTDVVPIGPPSLPSGMTQSWPAASPVTLHTLATLMISISDNTATDTLVTLEGAKLDSFAPGLAPILTTRQMFAIKTTANADLAARWATTFSPVMRRRLLDANASRLATTPIDPNMFGGKPVAIDTLEWFASPTQVSFMLDQLRGAGPQALAILAVNPGTDTTTRAKYNYVGFKGGSEPGVITLNYLVQRKDGRWLAIAGNWHRSDAGVDTAQFAALMSRALSLGADAPLPN